jgi:5-methylcytosine-specific restriction endonuclease McrA
MSKCFCCRKNVIYLCSGVHNTWQAGHIISHNNGGLAEINNLHPICKQCNNAMNDENWDDYVDRHKDLNHSWDWNIENYYKKYQKGIIWWQSLYRMHLSRVKSI